MVARISQLLLTPNLFSYSVQHAGPGGFRADLHMHMRLHQGGTAPARFLSFRTEGGWILGRPFDIAQGVWGALYKASVVGTRLHWLVSASCLLSATYLLYLSAK